MSPMHVDPSPTFCAALFLESDRDVHVPFRGEEFLDVAIHEPSHAAFHGLDALDASFNLPQ